MKSIIYTAQRALIFCFAILLPIAANALDLHAEDRYEDELIKTIDSLSQKQLDPALKRIEKLVNENPKFKLAQLIYADLLIAKSQPLTNFGERANVNEASLNELRSEAKQRWSHYTSPPNKKLIPASIIKLSDEVKHVVIVDLDHSRLYVFKNENGTPKLVKDYYATIGKKGAGKNVEGDNKTPIGVYNVTRYIADSKLPDLYGTGAFPIDYPNNWDRRLGKTGHGIWLHGTPTDTYSRPPLSSEGCVALSNDDFTNLRSFINVQKTPVVITREIEWLSHERWFAQQQQHARLLDDWVKGWESLDSNRYLSNYSKEKFRSGNKNYQWWSAHKTKVNAQKTFINVQLNDVSIFRYPGVENMLEFSFQQNYRSSNFNKVSDKRLYWQRDEEQQWRIIYEGPA